MATPIIIDTDPGIDDAMAILLALRAPELDVRALTTVHGNASVEQCTLNARKILNVANRCDVTVVSGAAQPLVRERLAGWAGHGPDALGGVEVEVCAEHMTDGTAVQLLSHRAGVLYLIETLLAADEPLTLVPIAPLTNIALALAAAPEIKPHVKEMIIMGGAVFREGNRTPAAEFNVLADPEAAKIVFHSGVPITLVGLDVTQVTLMTEGHVQQLEAANSRVASFVAQLARYVMPFSLKRYGDACVHLHDPLAIGVALDRSLVRTQKLFVDVETQNGLTLGKTIADPHGSWGNAPNVEVCVEVDAERFVWMMIQRLKREG